MLPNFPQPALSAYFPWQMETHIHNANHCVFICFSLPPLKAKLNLIVLIYLTGEEELFTRFFLGGGHWNKKVFFLALKKYLHILKPHSFLVHNSVTFDKYIELSIHHYNQYTLQFHHPKKFPDAAPLWPTLSPTFISGNYWWILHPCSFCFLQTVI